MRSLAQLLHEEKARAEPLPDRFTTLGAAQIRFRKGQVCMIAGQPGAFKSGFTLDYVLRTGVPTLYFSADSDPATVKFRAGAMLLAWPVDGVEQALLEDGEAAVAVRQALTSAEQVRFCFDPAPTLDDLELEIQAYIELFGDVPGLIVVDNLINVVAESDNEWQGLRELMSSLHQLARFTSSAVCVLHHTSEADGDPTCPPPRRAIHGKVSQLPELILTVAVDPAQCAFKVAAVKNRSGPMDASGRTFHTFGVDLARMQISEGGRHVAAVRDYWESVG